MQTADPGAARERVAILAARFVIVRADLKTMLEGQRNLTGVEIEAIFRRELEQQLGSWLSDAYADAPWSSSVIEEAARHGKAYRQLRLPDPRHDMDTFERAKLDAADRVKFVPIDAEEFDYIKARVADGSYEFNITAYQRFSVGAYKKWVASLNVDGKF